ncbi:GL22803 [Drosophila persimilis]|uniref:GL22803 n=1 Tax=Drosophila persimilis TaxID=7234 RepID=B4GZH5_DROPE|nr:GL22803 [Drosophila persimilis]
MSNGKERDTDMHWWQVRYYAAIPDYVYETEKLESYDTGTLIGSTLNNMSIDERVVSKIRPLLREPFSHNVFYDFKSYIETMVSMVLEPDLMHNRLDSSAVGSPADSGASS